MFRIVSISCMILCCLACGGGGSTSDKAAGGASSEPSNPSISSNSVLKLYISKFDDTLSVCAGSVIAEDSILTAGHCMIDATGGWIESDGGLIPIEGFKTHPNFYVSENGRIFNDVSIVYSKVSGDHLPIILSSSASPGTNISLKGANGRTFDDMRILELSSTHFIAEPSGIGSPCFGDSGSPAVTDNGILGVLSTITDRNCSSTNLAVFTAIDFADIIQFIEANVNGAQFD